MKKRKLISLILILLLVGISLSLVYTNAKYTSTVSGGASASVAKYVLNITGTDSYGTTDTIDNLVLAETCDPKTLVNGNIAPGTSGSMDIVLDATGSEVGIGYEVTFTNTSEHSLPSNLVITLDGENWDTSKKITGTIDANASDKTVTRTIEWSWAYETADETGSVVVGDTADTSDGTDAFDYSFTVTATGTQVEPIAE